MYSQGGRAIYLDLTTLEHGQFVPLVMTFFGQADKALRIISDLALLRSLEEISPSHPCS